MKIIDRFIVWYMRRHKCYDRNCGFTVRLFTTAFYNDIVKEALNKELKNENKRKYITCDNCGRKIYIGDTVYGTHGIIYNCCSAGCLAYLMLNYTTNELNEKYVQDEEIEWEGE